MIVNTKVGMSLWMMDLALALIAAGTGVMFFEREAKAEEDISAEVTQYLREHSTEASDDAWREKMHEKFKEKLARDDFYSSEEAVAVEYVFNWLSDHKAAFDEDPNKRRQLSDDEKLTICRMAAMFLDNNWKWPKKIAAEINKENFRQYIASTKVETTIVIRR